VSVAFDAAGSNGAAGTNTVTASITIGGGANRFLLAMGVRGVANTVSAFTFNGVALTSSFSQNYNTDDAAFEVRYIKEASLPAAGTYNLTFTSSASEGQIQVGGIALTGVDQTTPLDTPSSYGPSGSPMTRTGIASATGDMVVDFAGIVSEGLTLAPGTGQTERWEQITDTYRSAAMSTKAGAASVDVDYSFTGTSYHYAYGAVNVNAAADAAPFVPYQPQYLRSPLQAQ
jgi:hypothetical protein